MKTGQGTVIFAFDIAMVVPRDMKGKARNVYFL
jgi:hypothetical protein